MRYFFFLLFTVIICIQNIQGFVTLVNWKLNQAEITEKYCENKAIKEMKCNGKCYLAKQLKLQEDSEKSDLTKKNLPKLKKTKEAKYFFNTMLIKIAPETILNCENLLQLSRFQSASNGFPSENFHPPQV
jgi:hypothetical protein